MEFPEDWREFLLLLNSANIDYLIVGAHALAFHGHSRYTADLDIFVVASAENAPKLKAVIEEFGFPTDSILEETLAQPDNVFMMGVRPYRLDLLTSISGVSFSDAWARRVQGSISGIPTHFLSREDLILNKLSTGRPKDAVDADTLIRGR